MIYRVHAMLAFKIPDEGVDFYHDCEVALAKASIINPSTLKEERGFIMLERCWHDEDLVIPCETLQTKSPIP